MLPLHNYTLLYALGEHMNKLHTVNFRDPLLLECLYLTECKYSQSYSDWKLARPNLLALISGTLVIGFPGIRALGISRVLGLALPSLPRPGVPPSWSLRNDVFPWLAPGLPFLLGHIHLITIRSTFRGPARHGVCCEACHGQVVSDGDDRSHHAVVGDLQTDGGNVRSDTNSIEVQTFRTPLVSAKVQNWPFRQQAVVL